MKLRVTSLVCGLALACALTGAQETSVDIMREGVPSTFVESESPWVPRDPRVEPFLRVAFTPELDTRVPLDLEFMGADGMRGPLRDRLLPDKPVVLAIVYYRCPTMCNLVINDMVRALAETEFVPGEDLTVLAVSFDPTETHVTARGKQVGSMEMFGDDTRPHGWNFMVGNKPEIEALTQAVNFGYRYDPVDNQYAHGSGLLILTPDGRISRFLPGVFYPRRDLRLALVEASEGRIGNLSDRIALLCYAYDPETGKYGFLIHRVILVACLVTIAAVAWMIFGLLRLERKHRDEGGVAQPDPKPSAS